eukprot:m.31697 g.31697  ORF g.31697 m.31697 type:complete len:1022 (-) comp8339_c0_seq1:2098-5163(-)
MAHINPPGESTTNRGDKLNTLDYALSSARGELDASRRRIKQVEQDIEMFRQRSSSGRKLTSTENTMDGQFVSKFSRSKRNDLLKDMIPERGSSTYDKRSPTLTPSPQPISSTSRRTLPTSASLATPPSMSPTRSKRQLTYDTNPTEDGQDTSTINELRKKLNSLNQELVNTKARLAAAEFGKERAELKVRNLAGISETLDGVPLIQKLNNTQIALADAQRRLDYKDEITKRLKTQKAQLVSQYTKLLNQKDEESEETLLEQLGDLLPTTDFKFQFFGSATYVVVKGSSSASASFWPHSLYGGSEDYDEDELEDIVSLNCPSEYFPWSGDRCWVAADSALVDAIQKRKKDDAIADEADYVYGRDESLFIERDCSTVSRKWYYGLHREALKATSPGISVQRAIATPKERNFPPPSEQLNEQMVPMDSIGDVENDDLDYKRQKNWTIGGMFRKESAESPLNNADAIHTEPSNEHVDNNNDNDNAKENTHVASPEKTMFNLPWPFSAQSEASNSTPTETEAPFLSRLRLGSFFQKTGGKMQPAANEAAPTVNTSNDNSISNNTFPDDTTSNTSTANDAPPQNTTSNITSSDSKTSQNAISDATSETDNDMSDAETRATNVVEDEVKHEQDPLDESESAAEDEEPALCKRGDSIIGKDEPPLSKEEALRAMEEALAKCAAEEERLQSLEICGEKDTNNEAEELDMTTENDLEDASIETSPAVEETSDSEIRELDGQMRKTEDEEVNENTLESDVEITEIDGLMSKTENEEECNESLNEKVSNNVHKDTQQDVDNIVEGSCQNFDEEEDTQRVNVTEGKYELTTNVEEVQDMTNESEEDNTNDRIEVDAVSESSEAADLDIAAAEERLLQEADTVIDNEDNADHVTEAPEIHNQVNEIKKTDEYIEENVEAVANEQQGSFEVNAEAEPKLDEATYLGATVRMRHFVVLYDYDPSNSPNAELYDDDENDELPLAKGDIVQVFGEVGEDGFYHGRLASGPNVGDRGAIPSNYVKEMLQPQANSGETLML